jgi:uncharacterized membrane protein YdbT with pleckstrin-like domain
VPKQKEFFMSYIKKTLLPGENTLYHASPHWVVFMSSALTFLLGLFIFTVSPAILLPPDFIDLIHRLFSLRVDKLLAYLVFALAGYWFITATITYLSWEYGITNRRVLVKMGFVERQVIEIFLDKVEAVQVSQTILGRVLDYGTVTIVGVGGTSDPFIDVPRPLMFRQALQQQVVAWRKSMGHDFSK